MYFNNILRNQSLNYLCSSRSWIAVKIIPWNSSPRFCSYFNVVFLVVKFSVSLKLICWSCSSPEERVPLIPVTICHYHTSIKMTILELEVLKSRQHVLQNFCRFYFDVFKATQYSNPASSLTSYFTHII